MKVRTSIIAAGAAVVLGTTGALVLPAVASAHSASTTLKFISVQKASVNFGKTAFGQQDTDVNAAGKTIGFDMLYITAVSATTGNVNITGTSMAASCTARAPSTSRPAHSATAR